MKSVWMSSCTAVSTSESSPFAAGLSTAGGQKLMYPTSGRSGRPYQFCSSRPQVTAWAPVVGPHDCVGSAVTKTAKSASGMPWPPGMVLQLRPLQTLHVRDCCVGYGGLERPGWRAATAFGVRPECGNVCMHCSRSAMATGGAASCSGCQGEATQWGNTLGVTEIVFRHLLR